MEHAGPGLRVVAGLRTIEEILFLRRRFPQARLLLVDSDDRIRFERHIRRARDQDVKTYKDFVRQDKEQLEFGALLVASEIADVVVKNDGSIEAYTKKIDEIVAALDKPIAARPRGESPLSYRITQRGSLLLELLEQQ